ncbi:hypothetical protein, partial [Klebsiella pneumoniae]
AKRGCAGLDFNSGVEWKVGGGGAGGCSSGFDALRAY